MQSPVAEAAAQEMAGPVKGLLVSTSLLRRAKFGARAACALVAVATACTVETLEPSDPRSVGATSGAASVPPGGAAGGSGASGERGGTGGGGSSAPQAGVAGAHLGGSASGSAAAASGGAGSDGGGSGEGAAGNDTVEKSAGCSNPRTLQNGVINLQGRKYTLRVPDDYDNERRYRLILSFHGATGNSGQVAPSFFGLWPLSQGTTIFIAPDAVNGLWSSATDVELVDDILAQVEADLCIDTTQIMLEGFSQGGAMAWTLACSRPRVFRAAVVHSGGGLARPATCQPVAFMSSLGRDESGAAGQTSNSDFFAKQNGCSVVALAQAPSGGHACSDYSGCLTGSPTRWCDYDGGHTTAPNDAGQGMSWMPNEVWAFLEQF